MPNLIPLLADKPLAEVLEAAFVAPASRPLLKRHELSIGILQGAHRVQGRARSSSTSPTTISKATTNSSPITCIRNRSIAWG